MSDRDKILQSAKRILLKLSQDESLSDSELDAIRFLTSVFMDDKTTGENVVNAIRSLRKLGVALVQYNDLGQPNVERYLDKAGSMLCEWDAIDKDDLETIFKDAPVFTVDQAMAYFTGCGDIGVANKDIRDELEEQRKENQRLKHRLEMLSYEQRPFRTIARMIANLSAKFSDSYTRNTQGLATKE
ncbi:hypothetical protein I633_22326 (plasmid) [Alteromonas mediterranea 615]|uniref:Uncharacterized protein n=1 Tax=Alteromonas mediterranea 615 TaxID=1300253 RepID=S5ASP8_9ALTE|nr:hypothetical protein I633_22326 [Alteromonas mediterranea 615]|tara:strand:+ start:9018 stop:9575 length:558 start_codon:yes stop_codon:yes gene_type:complete